MGMSHMMIYSFTVLQFLSLVNNFWWTKKKEKIVCKCICI